MRFAANLSLLFPNEISWQERCQRVAAQGFKEVEILFPYGQPIDELLAILQHYELSPILINTPIEKAQFGLAALPNQSQAFLSDLQLALNYCQRLDVPALHVMAGCSMHANWVWQKELINNLQHALQLMPAQPIRLQLEALNQHDVPNYAYNDPRALLPILKHFKDQPVGLQFDFYHTVRQGYDLLQLLKQLRPYITHVQIADPLGRTAPDFDRHPQLLHGLNYLYDTGYQGSIGLEYRPIGQFEDSLAFLDKIPHLWRTPSI